MKTVEQIVEEREAKERQKAQEAQKRKEARRRQWVTVCVLCSCGEEIRVSVSVPDTAAMTRKNDER